MPNKLESLEKTIGYTFKNPALAKAALTHRSVNANNNERLEFIGDSIVNFMIAEVLFNNHPEATEGELSRLRSSLVRGETLALLAQEFSLGEYLHLGQGERKSGGKKRRSILADALEAMIAAIYFDSDFLTCRAIVLKWFAGRVNNIILTNVLKDPKTALQEYLQAHKYGLPTYHLLKTEGSAHAQTFTIECTVAGMNFIGKGAGSSRRKAEQEAAEAFLSHLGIEREG